MGFEVDGDDRIITGFGLLMLVGVSFGPTVDGDDRIIIPFGLIFPLFCGHNGQRVLGDRQSWHHASRQHPSSHQDNSKAFHARFSKVY